MTTPPKSHLKDELRRMLARSVANQRDGCEITLEFARTQDCQRAQEILGALFPELSWSKVGVMIDAGNLGPQEAMKRLKNAPFQPVRLGLHYQPGTDTDKRAGALWKEFGGSCACVAHLDYSQPTGTGPDGKDPFIEAINKQQETLAEIRKTIQAGLN